MEEDRKYVVAEIEQDDFLSSRSYEFIRCDGNGSNYLLQEVVLGFETVFNIYKDDILIGESSSNDLALCNPYITFADVNNTIFSVVQKVCDQSLFSDRWKVIILDTELVDSYIIGFFGYIYTLDEE